jgi:hypothetical protein
MNIRRGLLRMWLVVSGLFIAGVFVHFASEIRNDFVSTALREHMRSSGALVPVPCGNARGAAGADYETGLPEQRWPWESYGADPMPLCWYRLPRFHALYAEYSDLTDDVLTKRLYDKADFKMTETAPWRTVAWVSGLAVGAPLAVLAVVAALYWAIMGFRRDPAPSLPGA